MKSRLSSAEEAREIIENNIEEFLVWKEKRKNVPIIQQLKIKTETTSENEVKNAIKVFKKTKNKYKKFS